ncbi:MAG: hypothetical protein NW223_07030 [Hyphomicrobiaceae bacterium]|nr:hypothetical protein [Hyphomicrobiaceae bacterium]
MTILSSRLLGMTVAAAALALFAVGAEAQEKKADVKAAKKPAVCNSLKDQTACDARSDCSWVAESKDAKGKIKRKAYCRAKPAPKKK